MTKIMRELARLLPLLCLFLIDMYNITSLIIPHPFYFINNQPLPKIDHFHTLTISISLFQHRINLTAFLHFNCCVSSPLQMSFVIAIYQSLELITIVNKNTLFLMKGSAPFYRRANVTSIRLNCMLLCKGV